MSDEMPTSQKDVLSRRTALAIGGAATATAGLLVSGCSGGSSPSAAAADGGSPSSLGPASSIPVGGGVVFKDHEVVVTQPTPGNFRAFSSKCTHAGCQVTEVSDGTIICPCHISKFSAVDGSVQDGPAKGPLPARQVVNEGGTLRLA